VKNTLQKSTIRTLVIALTLLSSTMTLADTGNVQAITNGMASASATSTVNTLSNLYNYFQASEQSYIPFINSTMVSSPTQASILNSHVLQAQAGIQTDAFVFNNISPPPCSASQPNCPPNEIKSPPPFSPGVYASMIPMTHSKNGLKRAQYISSSSLFSSPKFESDTQRRQAAIFIQFVANSGGLITPLTPQALKNADRTTMAAYLNALGVYYAGQSVGLNAFYMLYNERVPRQDLQNESVLSYDENQILRRMQPAWIKLVSQMTAIDVLRESLYTHAEQNYEMFEIRMQLEQLNATMAAMQMQQQQLLATPALMAKEAQVQTSTTANSTSS